MRINPDFTIQKVGTSYVAVPIGETSKSFRGMVQLNETGAFLWKLMAAKDCSEEELVEAMLAEYEVSREVAAADVRTVVETLRKNNLFVK